MPVYLSRDTRVLGKVNCRPDPREDLITCVWLEVFSVPSGSLDLFLTILAIPATTYETITQRLILVYCLANGLGYYWLVLLYKLTHFY